MFKYLWIVILGIVVLVALVITVIDVVTTFKENWEYYMKERENGNILDVIEGTWDDIEEHVKVLITLPIVLLIVASFVTFLDSLGGVK